jgi:hypothetical protein
MKTFVPNAHKVASNANLHKHYNAKYAIQVTIFKRFLATVKVLIFNKFLLGCPIGC